MTIKRFEQIEPTSVPNGEGVTRRMLISPEEGHTLRCARSESKQVAGCPCTPTRLSTSSTSCVDVAEW